MARTANIPEYDKDPDAELPFDFDWRKWLDGETITLFTVNVPTGLIAVSAAAELTAGIITQVLGGGTAGRRYRVTSHVETATRKDDRSVSIRVLER